MSLLHVLGAIYAWYSTFSKIREFWRSLRDLIKVLNVLVSGNLSSVSTHWLLGLVKQNSLRLWNIIGPIHFGELYSWHARYRLIRDFWRSIRDIYKVSNAWLSGRSTYRDEDWMTDLLLKNLRRLRDFGGPRRMFCLRTIHAYS